MRHISRNLRTSRLQPTPEAPSRTRAALIYLIVALLGVMISVGRVPGAGLSGALAMLVGAGGGAWEVGQWAREYRRRAAAKALVSAKAEHKQVRRGRQAQNRERRQERREIQQRALHRQEQQMQTVRQVKSARAAQMEAQRLARFEQVVREAARLQSLEDAPFLRELPALFAQRGLRLEREAAADDGRRKIDNGGANRLPQEREVAADSDERLWDMTFLRLVNESREVARCLPSGRSVAVADVEAAEQWRVAANAVHAYLIGRSGFSAAALRLAPRFPITLVEPQLLAQWNITAMQQTRE